jgi:hypothetical protein
MPGKVWAAVTRKRQTPAFLTAANSSTLGIIFSAQFDPSRGTRILLLFSIDHPLLSFPSYSKDNNSHSVCQTTENGLFSRFEKRFSQNESPDQ